MKKRYIAIPIVMIAVLALAALSTPAMADYSFDGSAPTTRTDGTMNGTVFVDSVGWTGQTTLSGSFNVPAGTVRRAYLYTGVWGGTENYEGWVNVTFNNDYTANGLGPIHLQGINDNNDNVWCTGHGKYWWWYNVTNLTNAGQTNTATTSKINGTIDGRVYGIVLVVVLENDSLHPIQYWINDGSDGLNYVTPNDDGTTYFNGNVDNANVTKSALTMVHLTGYDPTCDNCLDFNDHPLDTSCVNSNNFEINTWDEANSNVTAENVTSSGNHADYRRGDDPYVNICNTILVLHNTSATQPDLVVSDIELPEMMRPNTDFTVKATITNQGSAAGGFNVSLYVNDVLNSTKQHVSSLAASASTEVSFTNVNLGKGCYEFKVVADVDGEVSESNENNNATSENGQVGYVIVVESDGDFEKLNASGSAPLPAGCFKNESGTYYIQNLTGSYAIENCAGNGISIENTNAPFVITNCTILNCTGSGVYLHNLTNGTVNESVMQNNSAYGIKVGEMAQPEKNPNLVNITNNTVKANKNDGVDLAGFNCTVKGNIIRDNFDNGIFIYGNNSNITQNTIQNNSDYGVKLYNSYDNDIYANEFIGNNINNPGHQAWDNRTTNYWNTTTIGNYWTDWDDNPGAPGNYSIDGGTNKDYEPRGLYVFGCNAGTDKWAYKYQVNNARPPSTNDVPSIEFNSTQYANIAANDGVFESNQTTDNDYYAAHRFNCSINSSISASDISMINATWNGKGWHDTAASNGAYLYICNFSAGSYGSALTYTGSGAEVTLTGGVTSDISNYINTNNVTVLVEQKEKQTYDREYYRSHIETDYIELVITPA
jgi:parallel beta-helix repeat protein